ncbi:MAG: transporter substrate-binding protein, partial [Microbacterium sp.]|nr:transporter substrate-binding protein [Microbacterium sp.]
MGPLRTSERDTPMLSTPRKRALAGLAAVAIGALALSACTSQRGGGGE